MIQGKTPKSANNNKMNNKMIIHEWTQSLANNLNK